MMTMQSVLQVGPFDWADHPVGAETVQQRLSAVQEMLVQDGLAGMLLYGDRFEYGSLAYLTCYAPRLGGALALVPVAGPPRILSFEGGRMVGAGRETTFVEDVQPVSDLAAALREWVEGLGGIGRLASCDFDLMDEALYAQVELVAPVRDSVDATDRMLALRRCKTGAEVAILASAAETLSEAEQALRLGWRDGLSDSACLASAHAAALRAGAQDVRVLYCAGNGGRFEPYQGLDDDSSDHMVVYLAVRRWGYWVDGFVTLVGGDVLPSVHARAQMKALLAAARPGSRIDGLLSARDLQEVPFGLGFAPINGIGTTLQEWPDPARQGEKLLDGDVCSVRAWARDEAGRLTIENAVIRIVSAGPEVIWSPDHSERGLR